MVSLLAFSPLLLAGLGAATERIARVRAGKRYSAPGNFQEVGGARLHYQVFGAHLLEKDPNSPVVLLEAEAADWSSHFGTLPSELGETCTVIAYDRAGLGWSQAGSGTRDADTLAKELHQLLIQVAPRRRALLVAHGHGTWIARMYAHRYPFETAGMVLLDGEHEAFSDLARRKGLPPNEASPLLLRLLMLANAFGLCRALKLQLTLPQVPGSPWPERQQLAMIARGYAPPLLRTILAEQEAKSMSRDQVGALRDQFEFPVRILAAGRSTLPEQAPKGFPTDEYNELYADLQKKLCQLSTDSTYTLVEAGNHYLALTARDWVKDAIADALEASARLPIA